MTPRAQAWMRQSRNDLEAARIMGDQGFHAQACYLAGQAAEKALKGVLLAAGLTPPYSHSLEQLVEMLEATGLETQPLGQLRLKLLTRMNSDTRYPKGDAAPVDLYDAHDSEPALATAEAVVQIAAAHLAG